MMKDKDGVDIREGDTIYKDGCLYVILDFVIYELVIEAVCEDKLSHQIRSFLLTDIMKLS